MQTFGERLKAEREGRGLSIEVVSEVVQLDPERLQALENNDFAKLPDEGRMTGLLEAYAACLQVDAALMIEDYDRERQKCLRQLAAALPDAPAEVAPSPMAGRAIRHSVFPRSVVVFAILAAVVVLAAWWMLIP